MQEKTKTYSLNLKLPNHSSMKFLKLRMYHFERDILKIAYSVFNIEREIREGRKINKLCITLDNQTFRWVDSDSIKKELEELLLQVLYRKITVEIKHENLQKGLRRDIKRFPETDNICLFSGGVDSFSGIFNAKKYLGNLAGVFIAHSDQAGVINITNKIIRKVLSPNNINCYTIYAPRMGSGGYSQLRGFLYFLSASIYMRRMKAHNLIITECGSTMYQPRFAPFDSVTMTTHPLILKKVKNIIENILNKKVNIVTPFENLTKSEIMVNSPFKEKIKYSHSCITERFRKHCGTCYGCVIRKIGAICAGIEDSEYMRNPFIDSNANSNNLISLMRFSYDLLTNYKDMLFFSKENIFLFNKLDLFKRFSLDTFSALYLMENEGKEISNKIKILYKQALSDIGKDVLEERIEDIRSKKNKPNFKKII